MSADNLAREMEYREGEIIRVARNVASTATPENIRQLQKVIATYDECKNDFLAAIRAGDRVDP